MNSTRGASAFAVAVSLALAWLLAAQPAAAAEDSYVALGDSYSSGVGTREYIEDGSGCQRSTYAYPSLEAENLGVALDFQACSGASTQNVLDSQVGALDADTALVTITVGGNDIGFSHVLTECAKPVWAADCMGAIDGAQAILRDELPGRLNNVFDEISERAPSADVVVGGYPRLFNGEDCNAGTWFGPNEQDRLNATADELAATIEEAASAHSFDFVDVRDAFTGHAVCDADAWINGLSNPVTESYHPNRDGQSAYADLFDPALQS